MSPSPGALCAAALPFAPDQFQSAFPGRKPGRTAGHLGDGRLPVRAVRPADLRYGKQRPARAQGRYRQRDPLPGGKPVLAGLCRKAGRGRAGVFLLGADGQLRVEPRVADQAGAVPRRARRPGQNPPRARHRARLRRHRRSRRRARRAGRKVPYRLVEDYY